ncbi:MAG: hypothetical protein K0Q47_1773 [Sedimentibacter sp.]|nr:hypothetical protein [Sedimentibacter sp.]
MSEADFLVKLLCENGYKSTIQRTMIYEILDENKLTGHFSFLKKSVWYTSIILMTDSADMKFCRQTATKFISTIIYCAKNAERSLKSKKT